MKLSEVFTAGGIPTFTYNDRPHLELESQLQERLAMGNKVISITGPSKIGKTVLWTKVIPENECVFVPGGNIREEKDIWNYILSALDHHSSWTEEEASEEETKQADSLSGGIQASVFPLVKAKADLRNTTTTGEKQTAKTSKSYLVLPSKTATDLLVSHGLTLVIDDFHYIDRKIQSDFIRVVKDPVARRGLGVIICAVPHRDHDALKAEPEMNGRVTQLPIEPWSSDELKEIAEKGFHTLNVSCPPETIDVFIRQSYKSPHLMQEFCSYLCVKNRIFRQQATPITLQQPPNYIKFFKEICNNSTSKQMYETLLKGPETGNRKRKRVEFESGMEGDIYLAIMHALAALLDSNAISTDAVRTKLGDILVPSDVPTKKVVQNTLQKMADIAKESVPGEPPVDYQDDVLHVVDPFFSFYLKWCDK